MPNWFGRKPTPDPLLVEVQKDIAQMRDALTRIFPEPAPQAESEAASTLTISQSIAHIESTLASIHAALTSSTFDARHKRAIEEALVAALQAQYVMLRDRGEYVPAPPLALPFDSSGIYLLPIDPAYHHQLLIAHPLLRHLFATVMVFPTAIAHVDTLPPLPNGVQRKALDINVLKAPQPMPDVLRQLHRDLWPVMWLVEYRTLPDGKVQPTYWRCTGTVHDCNLSKYPNYLCWYFEYQPEGPQITYDPGEMPSVPEEPPQD
jgi:hypothetical protein